MHAVLPAAQALFRRFGLSALVMGTAGQLYPRGMNFPTAIFDVRICGAVLVSGVAPASSRQRAAKMAALRSNQDSTEFALTQPHGVVCASSLLRASD
jgi:hypothetical protein